MEILGKYKVRSNGTINSPLGAFGDYTLELNDDGSFTYRPADGQVIKSQSEVVFEVWNQDDPGVKVSFSNEEKAIRYKIRMEKVSKKPLRLKKIFTSKGNARIVEG